MAGETIYQKSAWADLQAAASVTDGAVSAGTTTPINTAFGAAADYPMLDLKLSLTVGTPIANTTVEVYLQATADTTTAPPPTATFDSIYIGSFLLDGSAATQHYYIFDAPNLNSEGSLLLKNSTGATITIGLRGRAKTYTAAP